MDRARCWRGTARRDIWGIVRFRTAIDVDPRKLIRNRCRTGIVVAYRPRSTMPGDPKECRRHALNCMLLAKQASTEESQQTFLSLSQSWTRLATELEDAEAFLKDISEIEVSRSPQAKNLSPSDGPAKGRVV